MLDETTRRVPSSQPAAGTAYGGARVGPFARASSAHIRASSSFRPSTVQPAMVSRCRLARGAVKSGGLRRPTLMQACAAGEPRRRRGVARYPSPLERKRGLSHAVGVERRRREARVGAATRAETPSRCCVWRGIGRSEVGSRVVVCCRSRLAGFLAQRSGWPHLNRFGLIRGRAPSSRSTNARTCVRPGANGIPRRFEAETSRDRTIEPREPRTPR